MIGQAMILLCGVGTVFLSTAVSAQHRRLASPVGLLAQPFWFHAAYTGEQWGVLALSVLFASRWAQVFYRDWIGK